MALKGSSAYSEVQCVCSLHIRTWWYVAKTLESLFIDTLALSEPTEETHCLLFYWSTIIKSTKYCETHR